MFDVYLYPFGIKNKQEYSKIPGFLISTAPKKTSRNRLDDILLLYYVNYEEMQATEAAFLTTLLPKTKDLYFKTSGPITTAIKKAAEFLNDQILQFNLRQLKRPNLVGALQCMVIRENEAYIMHAGDATSFLLSRSGSERQSDPAVGGQGIGVSRGLRYKFHHVSINTGDRIVLISKPPKKWTVNAMSGSTRLSISHLRRLLISEAERDFETVVIQFRPGNRTVHLLKLNTSPAEVQNQVIPSTPSEMQEAGRRVASVRNIPPATERRDMDAEEREQPPLEVSQTEDVDDSLVSASNTHPGRRDEVDRVDLPVNTELGRDYQEDPFSSDPMEDSQLGNDDGQADGTGGGIFISGKKLDQLRAKKTRKKRLAPKINRDQMIVRLVRIRGAIRRFSLSGKQAIGKIEKGVMTLIARSTPGDIDAAPSLSVTGMFFIALIVPIVVVAVAMTVYLQNKSELHQEKIVQATSQINLAAESESVPDKIAYYQSALAFLTEAESYGSSDALLALKNNVEAQLDTFSGITRIPIQPSVAGGLVRKIAITKMVTALGEDVYALDENTGNVIRMAASKPDYTIDNGFICGPGKHGDLIVNNLVDIQAINAHNSEDIVLLGVDQYGSLLLCSTRGTPIAIKLQPPDLGWGHIQAIDFDGYALYLLDNEERTRDIYLYESNGLSFSEPAISLFEQNIPENLPIAMDMALYEEELYLLQENGMLSRCKLGAGVETFCESNIGYGKVQPDQGRQVVPVLENTRLQQISITQPPDPSIYLLDAQGQTVYHFSLAMNLQKQIKPNFNGQLFQPASPLSAFTISPSGVVHFAYGHHTYFGELP